MLPPGSSRKCRSATMCCRGGEAAALIVLDAAAGCCPASSGRALERGMKAFEQGLLRASHTRSRALFEGVAIPEVLLSGDHQAIAAGSWVESGDGDAPPPALICGVCGGRGTVADSWPVAGVVDLTGSPVQPATLSKVAKMNIIQGSSASRRKRLLPSGKFRFSPATPLVVAVRVKEGERSRIQNYEGRGDCPLGFGPQREFHRSQISYGEGRAGVSVYSPLVDGIKVVRARQGAAGQAHYLRGRTGKSARIAERMRAGGRPLAAPATPLPRPLSRRNSRQAAAGWRSDGLAGFLPVGGEGLDPLVGQGCFTSALRPKAGLSPRRHRPGRHI